MRSAEVSLDVIQVASPCTASWEDMPGDDRVRFCSQCKLNVFDLSAMSRAEAEAFVNAREGRLCVRFFRRRDGTILTQDCPVGLRAVHVQLVRAWTAFAACLVGLFAGVFLNRHKPTAEDFLLSRYASSGPLDQISRWTASGSFVVGAIFAPPTTAAPDSTSSAGPEGAGPEGAGPEGAEGSEGSSG